MSEKQKQNQKSMIFTDWECEKLNIKFCKYILGVNKKTTNLAVLAELAQTPRAYGGGGSSPWIPY
jgi:hypothetical protein